MNTLQQTVDSCCPETIRAAIYARVSSQRQTQSHTIDSQIEQLRQRAQADGAKLPPEMQLIDEGYSGGTLVRPGLERLRDLAAEGAIDRLYVLCPDRLARSSVHQAILVEELASAGVEMIFLNRPMGCSPEDQLLLQVQGVIAEYERAKILERCRRGKLHAARRGSLSVMSVAPYGYRYVNKHEGGGAARFDVRLDQAAVVRQIFQWVGVERISIGEAVRRLEKQGIYSPRGKPRWDRTTVWGILRNPAYKGEAAFGRTHYQPAAPPLRLRRGTTRPPRRGPRLRRDLPVEQWVHLAVPAIVDGELFDAVEEQLKENKRRLRMHPRGTRYLLAGLLVCKQCGYALCGRPARCGGGSRGYYRCLGADLRRLHGEPSCRCGGVRTDTLEQIVWSEVCDLLRDPQCVAQEYQRRLQDSGDDSHNPVKQLSAAIHKQQRGIARLIDAYAQGLVEKQEFEPRIGSARRQLQILQSQSRQLVDEQARRREMRLVIDQLETFAARVKEGLDQMDWPSKRAILRTLIRAVEVGPEEVRIIYRIELLPFELAPKRGYLQDCGARESASKRIIANGPREL